MQEESSNPINVILTEFGIRLNELEEKQRLLKDRILLVGNNLISTKESYEKQFLEIKRQLKQIDSDIISIRQLNERITNELMNFTRKSEFDILKRQLKMFEPLEFARIKDIKEIVGEELSKKVMKGKSNSSKSREGEL